MGSTVFPFPSSHTNTRAVAQSCIQRGTTEPSFLHPQLEGTSMDLSSEWDLVSSIFLDCVLFFFLCSFLCNVEIKNKQNKETQTQTKQVNKNPQIQCFCFPWSFDICLPRPFATFPSASGILMQLLLLLLPWEDHKNHCRCLCIVQHYLNFPFLCRKRRHLSL